MKRKTILGIIVVLVAFVAIGIFSFGCQRKPAVSAKEEAEEQVEEIAEEQVEEAEEIIVLETTAQETPPVVEETLEDSALETILKEKVSFISEALPGAELNTKTGELTARAGNEWGIKEGESIGWHVVKAFTMETADGVEKEQDAIGLTPKVISFIQKENFEKTKEQLFPIVFDLTVTKDVEMYELKTAGDEIGKKILAFNVPVGSEFLAPLSGGWGLVKPFPNVEDNCFFTDWNIGKEENLGGIDIYFKEAKILAEMKEGPSIPNLKTGTRQTLMSTHVELGDSLGMISSQISLEEFSRSGWGEYQLVTFLKNNDKIMEVGSGTNTYRVFILP